MRDEPERTSFLAPPLLRGSLTVEAAVVLPVFLACMLAVMSLLNVYGTADRLQSAMTQTSEEMAVGAYATKYGKSDTLLHTALTVGYGSARVRNLAGDTSAVKNLSFLSSALLQEQDMVDLVCTYRIRPPVGIVQMPFIVFIQRASVRAWTGRGGSDGASDADEGEEDDGEVVYVAQNGQVYHKDRNCTHIRLTITTVSKDQAISGTNAYGQHYSACEKCGAKAGSVVFVAKSGDRYHSSLSCSGLKRTVEEVKLSETSLRPCSRCGG